MFKNLTVKRYNYRIKEAKENYNIKCEKEKNDDIVVISNYKGGGPTRLPLDVTATAYSGAER